MIIRTVSRVCIDFAIDGRRFNVLVLFSHLISQNLQVPNSAIVAMHLNTCEENVQMWVLVPEISPEKNKILPFRELSDIL